MKTQTTLIIYSADTASHLLLPLPAAAIKAGFPSPAQDYLETGIDLNRELIRHPASTFLGRVTGTSMIEENICEGDILVIDKSLEPVNGDLAVCYIDGEFTLKRIRIEKEVIWLIPSNPRFPSIKVTAENEFLIWGVVTYTIRKNRKRRK